MLLLFCPIWQVLFGGQKLSDELGEPIAELLFNGRIEKGIVFTPNIIYLTFPQP